MSISLFRRAALATAVITLTACGGGGGGSDHDSTAPVAPVAPVVPASPAAPTQSGILTDSAVAGVRYTTSSGYRGTTDETGHFLYNVGETVTFKIGELTLGAVTPAAANATITPIELATASGATDQNKVTNILILLQSLDSDGDASNGITITPAANTAMTASVASSLVLTVAPTEFVADPDLSGVVAQVGGEAKVVTVADAQEHFQEEFFAKLTGTWAFSMEQGIIVFRFDATGNYVMGEFAPAGEGGRPGLERGKIIWNPATGEMTALAGSIKIDTNGEWGLSHPGDEKLYLAVEGDNTLVVTVKTAGETDEVMRWNRVSPASSGIAGSWGVDSGTDFNTQQIVFFEGTKYVLLDPVGDQDYDSCGGPGVELGNYSLTGGVLSFSEKLVDTNGCAGLHDTTDNSYSQFTASLNAENNTLTLSDGEVSTLYRPGIEPPLLSQQEFMAKLAGTWLFEPAEGVTAVFRFDASGNYIMGQSEEADESGHSGVERGVISRDPGTGEITASGITVDTNGEWGFSHPHDERLYFAIKGDLLVLTIKEPGEVDEVIYGRRVPAATNGIGGTWVVGDGNNFDTGQLIFLSGSRYALLAPVIVTLPCGTGTQGIELGHYSLGAKLIFSGIVTDTTGCTGFHNSVSDTYGQLTVSVDNTAGTMTVVGAVTPFYRAGVTPPAP